MKTTWTQKELIENFSFQPNELLFLKNKTGKTRLGAAIQFKFLQNEGRLPYEHSEIPDTVLKFVAGQVKVNANHYKAYDWKGRNVSIHRSQILEFFGFKKYTTEDIESVKNYLVDTILPRTPKIEDIKDAVYNEFRKLKTIPFSPGRVIRRIVKPALNKFEEQLFEEILQSVMPESIEKIEKFISEDSYPITDTEKNEQVSLNDLKTGPGAVGLKSMMNEVEKLNAIATLHIPDKIATFVSPKLLRKYYRRAASESTYRTKKRTQRIRHALLILFFVYKKQEIMALCLHLIQNCLIYVNALMIQEVLSNKKWCKILTAEDYRALTPLIYKHITPYGHFRLDMEERIRLAA